MVELRGVYKTYHQKVRAERPAEVLRQLLRPRIRRVPALAAVDLSISRGEIVAYAGPNGAGKSTTVKLLAGLLAPDAGSVRVLGMDPVRDRIRYVRRIGVVFGQRTELWWDHPVAASFEWKRVVWEIPRQQYARSLGALRELLGLDPFFNSLARELSLGQKMRADLALALLHEPEILLLDEPTLGLDVLAKRAILPFIREANRERRVTVLVTSHDMSDLEELAGRIVMIDGGRIAFDGDFARLRREVGDLRRLFLQTISSDPPLLPGATLVRSSHGRHEFLFDAARTPIATLLEAAGTADTILDMETQRAPIDDVVAEIFQRWGQPGTPASR